MSTHADADRLHIADEVVYEDDELVHIDCEGKQEPQRPERPACSSCWTTHAGECM